jgi:hypothetical protein
MAATHTARTIRHTWSEDGPLAPGAGNVRTQRATCGMRPGAISASTTAVPAAAGASTASAAARGPDRHAEVEGNRTLNL